ncbi:MAG: IS66 family transposase [Deltaproteobacteria bacterium]|nr:IS66 family transposase [Deltaproteobacteria bacterium]
MERRLGLDSSNSGKPPSSAGYKKKPRPLNLREKTDKKAGGQAGHEGKNLRQVANPDKVVDYCPCVCASCGAALDLDHATGHRKRQTFELPKPHPVEVTEPRASRCQCPCCGAETEAAFPAGVTAPAQYGPHIAALVVYLQHWHFIPEDRLAELMGEVFGVELSAATIATRAQRKAEEWTGLAAHMGAQVKQAAVKHLDETGYRLAGLLHWLHVASTWLLTFYRTSRKRGAMWEGVEGMVVHDFWRPYFTRAGVAHALCNAHHLRELKALSDIEQEPWAGAMYRFLRHACHAANLARQRHERLNPAFLVWLQARYDRILVHGVAFHEGQPPLETLAHKRRGRTRRRTGHNLLVRLHGHKDEGLRFLTNPAVPFTNNQAERDMRMMKLKQKISGCFRAQTGAQTFAILRTVLSTARKQGWNILDTLSQPSAVLVRNLRTT